MSKGNPSIQITLVSPPTNNQYLITPTPSMPVIQATAAVINATPDPTDTTTFTWYAALKILENGGSAGAQEDDYDKLGFIVETGPAVQTKGSQPYTLTFVDQKIFLGGELTLTVTATLANGQVLTATTPANLAALTTTPLEIYGTNPQRSAIQSYIISNVPSSGYSTLQSTNAADALQRMACEESGPAPKGQTQFSGVPGGTGPPIVASDNGIGIMQVTVTRFTPDYYVTNPGIVFNWQTNITSGLSYFQEKARTAYNYPGSLRTSTSMTNMNSYQYWITNTVNVARAAAQLAPITILPAPNFTNSGNIGSNPPNQLLEDAVRGYNGFSGTYTPQFGGVLHEFVPNTAYLVNPNTPLSTLSTDAKDVWMRVCSTDGGNGALFGNEYSATCAGIRPAYVNNIAANTAQCPAGANGN